MTSKEKVLIYHQYIFLRFIYAGLGGDFGIQLGRSIVDHISSSTISLCRKMNKPKKFFIVYQFINSVKWQEVVALGKY